MSISADIDGFITSLATTHPDRAFNQYAIGGDNESDNEVRRNNLRLYLGDMASRQVDTLLVGEAPGYQGSRQTGVPFMSEFIMLEGISEIDMFGEVKGYAKSAEFPDKIWKEPSATIVWGAMRDVVKVPLIWAAFPFHPFGDTDLSNRAPTRAELEVGKPFLQEIIRLFKVTKIIAVGNQAKSSLDSLGYDVPKIRHPSHGGKNDFIDGLRVQIGMRAT